MADISSDAVIQTYARIDYESRQLGRRMGKNDLLVKIERIDLASLMKPST